MTDDRPVSKSSLDCASELITGFRASQLVRAAVALRIPDLIATESRSVEHLANETGVAAGRLRRALRGLASLGVLEESADGTFTNTEVGALFREQGAGLARMTLMILDGYRAFEYCLESLLTGRTGQLIAFGEDHWQTLARDPEQADRFNRAMVAQTEQAGGFVSANLDLKHASVIVDVGGGTGALAAGLLDVYPDIRGIVCDLPAGLVGTNKYLAARGVGDRCAVVEADFFEQVPSGGDVYLLKQVIHDWDDEHSGRILANCRKAMAPGARIVLIERLLPTRMADDPEHRSIALLDLEMMVRLGGRERTLDEYRDLLERAGFRFLGTVPGDRFNLIEALVDSAADRP